MRNFISTRQSMSIQMYFIIACGFFLAVRPQKAMDSNVASTIQNLTSAAQIQETTMMLMQPNANWEQYLTPAPLSILIMVELIFISSGTDFSINKNPPPGGFKYIQYPESFRASLMQIVNSGWRAFNKAHNNMNRIRIHTALVPDDIQEALKILFRGSDETIEALLPNQLENIRTVADQCVTLASDVEKKYSDIINLIQELLEACINAEYFYGEELEEVKMKLENAKIREKDARELNEWSKKTMEAMSKQLEEVQHEYKEAMNSLPSGWEMIGMDFVEGITSALTGFINIPLSIFSSGGGAPTYQNTKNEKVDIFKQVKVFSKSGEILRLAQNLKQYVKKDGIDWKELNDQKNKYTKTTLTLSRFERIFEDLKKMAEGEVGAHALSLCKRGISICNELAKYSPVKTRDDNTTEQLIEEVQKLYDDVLAFDSQSKAALGSPALDAKPPMLSKAERGSQGGSASQRAAENARYRIEQSQDQLKQAREHYDRSVENMQKNHKELTEVLVEMQNCKIKEIDFETTIKMLVKGLDAMGRVKEQWEKMVLFFQMVSSIVQASLSKTLNNFITASDDTRKLSYDGKLFAKDILYKQALQASNIASLVHMISGTYTEVSNKYLMDKVSSLGKLMVMDKSKPEFMLERLKLQQSCKEAQEGILQLVLKNKEGFKRKTNARIAKLESALKALLPAVAPQERIQENTEDGLVEEDHYMTGLDKTLKQEL